MRVDNVNPIREIDASSSVDITWNRVISDAECEIKTYKDKINKLRKSINFFKKQQSLGLEFPRLRDKA
ncbi:MAG: hypothetical protein WCA10_22685 [Terracidiphilus sp.]